ncbi:hypothetical protein KPL39_08995 [Clostridium gasigenes]|uniref:hypothetical protein n=1 Tax=Clostridium gasigenes TaxID=94869 RepID=UPI001C0D6E06|nr:hypothetical protein [Clostridium gasigenes]MBU3136406.1 hypothetical protein [Clostridium gasigenes]
MTEVIIFLCNKIKDIISNQTFIGLTSAIGTVVSAAIAYNIYMESRKPKITLDYEKYRLDEFRGKGYKNDLIAQYETKQDIGFTNNEKNYVVDLVINNSSDYSVTDLIIKYNLYLYKSKVEVDKPNIGDFERDGFVFYKKVECSLKLEYLPPRKKIVETIFVSERIPYCEIKIKKVKSIEKKFYKKEFLICKFNVFDEEKFADMPHLRRILGIMW